MREELDSCCQGLEASSLVSHTRFQMDLQLWVSEVSLTTLTRGLEKRRKYCVEHRMIVSFCVVGPLPLRIASVTIFILTPFLYCLKLLFVARSVSLNFSLGTRREQEFRILCLPCNYFITVFWRSLSKSLGKHLRNAMPSFNSLLV